MKYTNQLNVIVVIIAVAVVVYALASTFISPNHDAAAVRLPEIAAPRPGSAQGSNRSQSVTPPPTVPARASEEASTPAVTDSSPAQTPAEGTSPAVTDPGRPTNSGAATNSSPTIISVPGAGNSSAAPSRSSMTPAPRSPRYPQARPQSVFPPRQNRPGLPPRGQNSLKRQGGSAASAPPVRSSMPEQNPPR